MTSQDAARVLNAVARSAPEYEALSAEYGAVVDGAAVVPEGLPEAALSLLWEEPEAAARIARCEENLSHAQPFGGAGLLTPQFLVTVLVLLSVYGGVEYRDGKWKIRAGFKPLNMKAMKEVLSLLMTALGKFGKGLAELSETMDGPEK